MSTRLQTASNALDLIYDGPEDPSDAFPNAPDACEQCADPPAIGPHDTNGKLQNELYESVRKYRQKTSRHVGGPPGEGVDGVVLLSGRLGTTHLRRIGLSDDEEGCLYVIAPFHSRVTRDELDELFELLGVSKRGSCI